MEIYRGRRLWIEKCSIQLPNGITRERGVVHPSNAVAVFPHDKGRCKLLRQYRYAIGQYILEVPAGTLDLGEDPEKTAERELIEETGFAAATYIPKGFIYTTPGYTDEKIFLFEARDLTPSHEYSRDDDEIIEVTEVPLQNLAGLIGDGTRVDAKTICLIHKCLGC